MRRRPPTGKELLEVGQLLLAALEAEADAAAQCARGASPELLELWRAKKSASKRLEAKYFALVAKTCRDLEVAPREIVNGEPEFA